YFLNITNMKYLKLAMPSDYILFAGCGMRVKVCYIFLWSKLIFKYQKNIWLGASASLVPFVSQYLILNTLFETRQKNRSTVREMIWTIRQLL
ncbi:MAG: hypothetical protein JJU13_13825, partial [Balneolaceae bacterium]|nr:hypothetical protein [Balneolaceae bacterium]